MHTLYMVSSLEHSQQLQPYLRLNEGVTFGMVLSTLFTNIFGLKLVI